MLRPTFVHVFSLSMFQISIRAFLIHTTVKVIRGQHPNPLPSSFCLSLVLHHPFREPLGAKGNLNKPPSSPAKEEWGRTVMSYPSPPYLLEGCDIHGGLSSSSVLVCLVSFLYIFHSTVCIPWLPVTQFFCNLFP